MAIVCPVPDIVSNYCGSEGVVVVRSVYSLWLRSRLSNKINLIRYKRVEAPWSKTAYSRRVVSAVFIFDGWFWLAADSVASAVTSRNVLVKS